MVEHGGFLLNWKQTLWFGEFFHIISSIISSSLHFSPFSETSIICIVDFLYQPSQFLIFKIMSLFFCSTFWEMPSVLSSTSFVLMFWLRIHLAMQGTQVQFLVWEDPTCQGVTKPLSHNYWAHSLELESWNYWILCALKPVFHNKRSHHNEKPVYHNWREYV